MPLSVFFFFALSFSRLSCLGAFACVCVVARARACGRVAFGASFGESQRQNKRGLLLAVAERTFVKQRGREKKQKARERDTF